ncbi:NFX1-type zinc finger-containing protein 1 [Holothuria leucospilota]|uniref:NFX1-type zinc finger-containing protein 1 n=1 Tax=Holothuria leucospilota TaxID=206669 RepID=A0A9Q1CBB2_HOLLE|nr:NFX1-type zinc finger-containing protein 1 [Holothuria leucospilota]
MATRPKVLLPVRAATSRRSSRRRVCKEKEKSDQGGPSKNNRSRGRGRGALRGRSTHTASHKRLVEHQVTHPMGMTFLTKLDALSPEEVVSRLYIERKPLENLLDSEIPADTMRLLVNALGKVCSIYPTPERVRNILLILHEKRFLDGNVLGHWISTWILSGIPSLFLEMNLQSTLHLLSQMLLVVPDSAGSAGVILLILKGVVKECSELDIQISAEITSKLIEISEKHSNLLQESREMSPCKTSIRHGSEAPPPDDFRKIPVLPLPHELKSDFKPFLRTNIVNGQYQNIHHYLDIQFRLLREDFIQPLREGIAEYITEMDYGNPDMRNMNFQNFRLYNKVRAVEMKPIYGGVAYVLEFDVDDTLKKVKWEISKRLIYGALVCLSKDHFKTLIFGVVVNRDPRELKEGIVEVEFKVEEEVSQELLSCSFQMAESSSYFEAYRHVLECLKTIDQSIFPFSEYFVSVSKEPHYPQYIRKDTDVTFNLPCTLIPRKVRVCDAQGWPEAEQLGFDDSQMNAYKAALTEEVCLIQGPPGTGKTYVGLKIVETLLQNKHIWSERRPLLVVCYTNHALDQFLEGILDRGITSVVRIGGRSSSERLKELNINKIHRSTKSTRKNIATVRDDLATCAFKIQQAKEVICTATEKLLKRNALEHVMTRRHFRNLGKFTSHQQCDIIFVWLCCLNETGLFKHQYPPTACNAEKTVSRRFGEMGATALKKQRIRTKQTTDTDYDEELFQRYLDDEDDFLDELECFESTRSEEIAINIPEILEDMESGQWYKVNRRKPRDLQKYIERKLMSKDMMTKEEVDRVLDVWSLNEHQRWRLYRWWIHLFINDINGSLHKLFADYDKHSNIFKEVRERENFFKLLAHSVIGVTTTGAAKYNRLLKKVGPPIIIIEEAAEILEAHVITSLSPNCQHLILIGDHQQLRPNPTVYKLCKDYKLDVSLFERLINNGMPCHRLSLQHRMRPEISHLLKIHKDFYPDLSDHKMVTSYDHIKGIEKDVYFIEHDRLEKQDGDSRSRSNLHEATFLSALCKYLLQQGYNTDQITILTAYMGQVRYLKQMIGRDVRICPIDNFQGEENDIILFSFVRSNEEGNIGFLKVSNRVCVALSRAKKGLYCIGNFTLLSEQSELWKVITENLRESGSIGPSLKLVCRNHPQRFADVSCSGDFRMAPDGGCTKPCAARLNCGHTCQKKCHPEDREHRKTECKKQCKKIICKLEHQCPLKCYQPCDTKCKTEVTKQLPCLHNQNAPCFIDPADVKCQSKCERRLKCGHCCREKCSDPCTSLCQELVEKVFQPCGHIEKVPCSKTKCPKKCKAILKCDHVCQGTCGECENGRLHVQCQEVCKRILICGHTCESKCSMSCPPCRKVCENRCLHNKCERTCGERCAPCKEDCKWKCKHFKCSEKCGNDCNREQCNDRCRLRLKCKHPCIGICGEPCPKMCRVCNREDVTRLLFGHEDEPGARFVVLKDCSHIVEVSAMDRLMQSDGDENEIKLPVCPWCKAPIRHNTRYNRRLHEIRRDIEMVKEQIRGDEKTIKIKSLALLSNVRKQLDMMRISKEMVWVKMIKKMEDCLKNSYTLSLDDLCKIEIQLNMCKKLNELTSGSKRLCSIPNEKVNIGKELGPFRSYTLLLQERTSNFHFVSQQEVDDWQREYKRCKHSLSVVQIKDKLSNCEFEIADMEEKEATLKEVHELLSDGQRFDNEKEAKVESLLKSVRTDIPLRSMGITEKERDMIFKAIKLSRAHWFKCPNGHVYAIDGCTGAMERSICTGCQASIGGERHRLDVDNNPAPEMYDNLWTLDSGKDN